MKITKSQIVVGLYGCLVVRVVSFKLIHKELNSTTFLRCAMVHDFKIKFKSKKYIATFYSTIIMHERKTQYETTFHIFIFILILLIPANFS